MHYSHSSGDKQKVISMGEATYLGSRFSTNDEQFQPGKRSEYIGYLLEIPMNKGADEIVNTIIDVVNQAYEQIKDIGILKR